KLRLGLLTKGVDVRGGWPELGAYDDLREYEDVPVEEFVVEHTTRGVYEEFLEPLLDAKFGSRKEDVSAAWFLGRVQFRGERDLLRGEVLGYFDGGFGRLLDRLVDAVGRERIETGTRVTDVGVADGRVASVTLGRADGTDERTVESDGVVVATMPNVLEALTGHECAVDFQGALCAVVTLSEPLTDTYWLNVAHDAPFGALVEHTNFVPPERYGGDNLLYVASYVQRLDDPLWRASDAEVEDRWLSEIESMFPGFERSSVESFRLSRAPRAAPVYERGYLDLVVPYDLADEVAAGLYYAGMASPAQYPERSLDGGVVAGYECADLIVEQADEADETAGRPVGEAGDPPVGGY
ncbi:MAG: protoporphyrinogen oxidase, partial [uncultured archaeon A07HB70]